MQELWEREKSSCPHSKHLEGEKHQMGEGGKMSIKCMANCTIPKLLTYNKLVSDVPCLVARSCDHVMLSHFSCLQSDHEQVTKDKIFKITLNYQGSKKRPVNRQCPAKMVTQPPCGQCYVPSFYNVKGELKF